MRLGILISGSIARWQLEALERACVKDEIFLILCPPERPRPSLRHPLYYLLNLFTIRNRMTKHVRFPDERFDIVGRFEFSPGYEGPWAVLPDTLLDWAAEQRLDAIIKFGLGLVRVPPPDKLPIPILSFHHGDPREYRGRPAGFYELLHGRNLMGQVVQAIGPKLDGGTFYAFAESAVVPHSYRKTLVDAYSLSTFLLATALQNLRLQRPLAIDPTGKNYRLPGNAMVVRFVAGRIRELLRRLAYGAFVEKKWKVATTKLDPQCGPIEAVNAANQRDWNEIQVERPYTFYADPFYGPADGEILVEALNARTGKGEIVRLAGAVRRSLRGFAGHVSYPAGLQHKDRWLLIPEIAAWSSPQAFEMDGETARRVAELRIDESGIVDPTLLRHGGRVYLFGNVKEDGVAVLHLWHADDLFDVFERHPASPVRVSVRGSRMAGQVAQWDGQLYRLGQDRRASYGDGVLAFRIMELSATSYREEAAGEAAFTTVRGPHTVNRSKTEMLFDYYTEQVALLAGVRRLLGRL
jgi:hypothetical protein